MISIALDPEELLMAMSFSELHLWLSAMIKNDFINKVPIISGLPV
jgi:hypothetical protein